MKTFSKLLSIFGFMTLLVISPVSLSFAEMSKWNLDYDHSTIGFQVKHMVISKTNGKFLKYKGIIEMDPETQQFKTIHATIDTNSVFTDHEKRDAHLRSPDFFDAETCHSMALLFICVDERLIGNRES